MPPPSSQPQPQNVDVRTLTLTQLQHFAKRGSRRAKAEIERRMLAADEAPVHAPAPRPRPAPTVPGELGATTRPPRHALPTVPGELAPRPRPAPTVPGELGATRPPRHALPTVPGELAPRPRPAPTVPGALAPTRPRPAPTVPGELGATRPPRRTPPTVPGELAPSSMPRHGLPTVPGELAPRSRPAPAHQAVDLDIGSTAAPARQSVDLDIGNTAAPARRFTSAPFPTTEMLGDLLPLADSPTHPHTNAYSVEVRPGDIPLAEPQAPASADVPPLPHAVAHSPVFPTTEVLDDAHKPSARSASRSAAAAQDAPDSPQPLFRESRARDTQPPPVFTESRAPSSFVVSRAPSSFSDSHAQDDHPRQRRKPSARPEGVPSRPVPLHIPEHDAKSAPPNTLDSQQERIAEHLAVISKQESAQSRADDVPRLIGLVMMVWGIIVTFGGIFMLAKGHGFYFLASGAAVSYVGWLLYKLKRLALPLHVVFLLAAVIWAWSGKSVSALEALTQSAPLLIPALWMLVPSVREPLN